MSETHPNITEWFDINNRDHLWAWQNLTYNGCWPVGFIPAKVVFSPGWHEILESKMARAFVNIKLGINQTEQEHLP